MSNTKHHHQVWYWVAYCLYFLLEVLWFQVLYSVFNPSWVNFCVWYKRVVQFHSSAYKCPIFPPSFIEKTSLSHRVFLAHFSNIRWPYMMGFNFRVSILSYRKRRWHPTSVLLPGKSHGWRSLVSCSPWGHEESDTTECLPFHFSLSCIGEGNGNPLHCSCLENPRDGGAWWAAICGVARSRTRLKRLSSSSSSILSY